MEERSENLRMTDKKVTPVTPSNASTKKSKTVFFNVLGVYRFYAAALPGVTGVTSHPPRQREPRLHQESVRPLNDDSERANGFKEGERKKFLQMEGIYK